MTAQRVALVNPNRWLPHVAPVALEYISSALDDQGISADILDLCRSSNPVADVQAYLREHPTDLVGISQRNLDDIHYGRVAGLEIRDIIRAIRDATDAPIVLGGSGFSICPEQLLDYYDADLGITGEGEISLPMLAKSLGDDESYPGIPGLVYRTHGGFRRNPPSLANLEGAPLSGEYRVDYTPYVGDRKENGGACVQTKRGCPMGCIYCVVPEIEGRSVRLRSAVDVVDEIEGLLSMGMKRIFIADSEFNCPEEHAQRICREIISRKLGGKVRWFAYLSPKPFSLDLAKLMVEAGCTLAMFSTENANDKVLRRLGKDFTADDIRAAARACRDAGLVFYCSTMFGGPGETMDTILETLNLFQEIGPNGVTYRHPPGLRIYPNTPLAELVREEGFSPQNPNLHGCIRDNEDLLLPVYYLSAGIGPLSAVAKAWRKLGRWTQRFS